MKLALSGVTSLVVLLGMQSCSPPKANVSWPVYKGDPGSSSYSTLRQIHTDNVSHMIEAWEFNPNDAPAGVRYGKYECHPIVIDNVIYATSARHTVYAIDGTSGEKIWSFDPFRGGRGGGLCRGVTFWTNGQESRILFTADGFLYALESNTGEVISSFGEEGRVNLEMNLGVNPDSVRVRSTTPGIIYKDLIIMGSAVSETYGAAPGHIRAYDVRSGEMEWIFHTIPHPGEEGYDTWPKNAWKTAGAANNWAGMSLDVERGLVYVPLGSPAYDFYGADRIGKNLYGNALVVLSADNGKLQWHFQTVHHDLWDYDLPSPPTLIKYVKNDREIDAVSLTTKTGFLFLFDRETGEPLYPIEERPVPPAVIEGESAWPTQPFPTHPPPFSRQRMGVEDVTDVSENARDSVMKRFLTLRSEGLFTPAEERGTVLLPGSRGGAEWGGSAYDSVAGLLYINANESPEILTLKKFGSTDRRSISFYDYGQRYYTNFCENCHGKNLEGDLSSPSLENIEDRLAKEETIKKIKDGGGRMPGFNLMTSTEEDAILSFLYEEGKDTMVPRRNMSSKKEGYRNVTAYSYFLDPDGYPAVKQPWGTLTAYNVRTGEYQWQVPLGNFPERQKDINVHTGAENWGGPIVTAGGLIFIGATKDEKFRAFDKHTGRMLWETEIKGGGYATPTTYMANGVQYVLIAVSGTPENPSGSIKAFAVPKKMRTKYVPKT